MLFGYRVSVLKVQIVLEMDIMVMVATMRLNLQTLHLKDAQMG